MTDFVILLILVVICGAAARYVYKAKKSGAKCIGCSAGEGGCSCGCSCGSAAVPESQEETGSCCCCHTDAQ